MSSWMIGILPLAGVVLGALLQFWLTRAAEREKHVDTLRSQAYADYLRAVAAAAHLRSDEDLRDALRDLSDAKARIVVYGSSSVIEALARFEDAGAVISGPAAQLFVSAVSRMREGSGAISSRGLELLLLGAAQPRDAPERASRRK